MARVRNTSYLFFVATFLVIAWFEMATPFITVLFSKLALDLLYFNNRKIISIMLFVVLVLAAFIGLGYFSNQAIVALPKIIRESIPIVINHAQERGIELPFTDLESLKSLAIEEVTDQARYLANFAKLATKEFVLVVIGFVIAISVFINSKIDLFNEDHQVRNNLYSRVTDEIGDRFSNFYQSFRTVMGAQMIISAINASLTGIFLFTIGLPYGGLITVVAFLVGLIPIVGNLISNTIIFCVAIRVSLSLAIASLIFLIVLHKFEYFLNSKIIGGRIRTPMWLTLIGLIVGEGTMGIPGMILAPVVLHYVRVELSAIELVENNN